MSLNIFKVSLAAAALALAACGGGSGGSNPPGGNGGGGGGDSPEAIFAKLQCDEFASGPIEGPLDAVQEPLVNELAGAFGDIPELGESAAAIVVGLARFLDVIDALAASGTVLFTEQDPEAAGGALDGSALAVQCGAKSLFEAYTASPIAEMAPGEVEDLVAELVALATVFDGMDSLGPKGLEDLTARLAGVADALAAFPEVLPADFGALPDELPAEAFFALLQAPSDLLRNLGDVLISSGQLDGQSTADNIAIALNDLLGGLAAFAPGDEAGGALAQVQEQLANGFGLILVPLFDALGEALNAGAGGNEAFALETFGDFLFSQMGGGAPDGGADPLVMLQGLLGAAPVPLDELLGGVPVLGDILGLLLSAGGGDFDFTDPAAGLALLTGLIDGQGGDGAPDLLSALQEAAGQLQGLAPGGFDIPDFGEFPTDAAALEGLLAMLQDNPVGDLLAELTGSLGGGGTPAFGPEMLTEALEGLLGGLADLDGVGGGGGGGFLGGLIDSLLGLLTDNPLAGLITGLLGGDVGDIGPDALTQALGDLLGGFGEFAP